MQPRRLARPAQLPVNAYPRVPVVAVLMAGLRDRLPGLVTAVLGVALLAGAAASTVTAGREAALADLDRALSADAVSHASALKDYFERAQSIDLLLAHDLAFQQFAPGRAQMSGAQAGVASLQVGKALAYLEKLYPGRISEACFIDATGTEQARVVGGRIIPAWEMSRKEATNPFFAPTLRLPQGHVYQAAPYVSQDTHEWVMSNSTPLVTANGRPWAMVHFEVTLDSFRRGVGDQDSFPALIVDNRTGHVVLDSGRPLVGSAALGRDGSAQLRALVTRPGAGVSGTVEGQRMAVARMPFQQDNANSWSVLSAAPIGAVGWSRSIGPAPMATALAALLLLGFGGVNLRASRRRQIEAPYRALIEHRALHDELTGLPNRALLFDRFEQALRGAERSGTRVGLLLLDLERFKEVNDTFGHHYGDELLRQIGPRLALVLRGVDTIARLGGDEFAVLLPDVHGVEEATNVASNLLAELALPFDVEGVELDVDASVGVVISGEHGQDVITLLQRADIAMYVAKTQNLGVSAYDPTLDGHSASKLALVGDLRRALDGGELVLHYQPKVNVITGDLVGAEALVRWQHPEHGLVYPDAFIPLAESTGLIHPLTHYVLEAALAQARTWLDAGRPVPIAVNLSARNLHHEGFAELVGELLAAHAVPAALLELEVTESAIMIDPVRARHTLEKLSDLGIRLSLDDFGTGYTSLSQLTTMPFSEIKIDRAFVMTMIEDSNNSQIVQSVISLGHNLGKTLVAEGVETQDSLIALAHLQCDFAQGYHVCRPMPVAAFDTWSAGHRITPVPTSHRYDPAGAAPQKKPPSVVKTLSPASLNPDSVLGHGA